MSEVSASKRRRVQPEVTEDGTLELPIKFNRWDMGGGGAVQRGAGCCEGSGNVRRYVSCCLLLTGRTMARV